MGGGGREGREADRGEARFEEQDEGSWG